MKDEELFLDIVEYTNQAMLYELLTYPAFGKVSIYSNGAHDDMNHYTFIDSISVLNKYMYQFAKLGYSSNSIDSMYDQAVKIGLECEKEMLQKTQGINTHKGLVFVLGTLVCSSMKAFYDKVEFKQIYHYVELLTKPKLTELEKLEGKAQLSHGENIYLKYQVAGVRKEAYLGFPIIQSAIKILNLKDPDSHVKALIYIMSQCEDTTILHRVGLEGLTYVKKIMDDLYRRGFNKEKLVEVQNDLIQKRISPGGSADLLCGTFFLLLINNKFTQGVVRSEW